MDDELERRLATASAKAEKSRRGDRHTKIVLLVLVTLLAIAGVVIYGQAVTNAGLAERNAVAANSQAQEKQTLADEFAAACAKDDFRTSAAGRAVCAKAQQVAAEQPKLVAGPQGEQGPPGRDGIDGVDGRNGIDGKNGATGKDGAPGANGTNGADGTDGLPGPPGAQGPAGPQGEPGTPGAAGAAGADGKDGSPPASFTFTDSSGVTYTCTPNPPGSTTYACAATAQPTATPTGGA